MLLLTQFPLNYYNEKVFSATSLSYIYLSRCIEKYIRSAYDSYRSRAVLLHDHESPMVWQNIIRNNLGFGVLIEPFIISDYFFASQAVGSTHQNALISAKKIHQRLEDLIVGGKEADKYSLLEMAEFGEKRHSIFFKILEKKYNNGEFDITINDLKVLDSISENQ